MEAYAKVATWSSAPQGAPPGAFLEPRGLTVDPFDGNIYVVDGGNHRVQVFQPDGSHVQSIGDESGPGRLDSPQDVTVQGSLVFVTDPGQGRVALFTTDGDYFGEWSDLAGPWGIATAADGRVFVVENEANRVAVFRTDGRQLATWAGGLGGAYGLVRPRGADVLPDGRLVVADYGNERFLVFGRDGLPDTESNRVSPPMDVASDALGRLYGLHEDGHIEAFTAVAGLPSEGRRWPLAGAVGIAATADGTLYASFADDARPLHGVQHYTGLPLVPADTWAGVPAPLGRLDAPYRVSADVEALVVDAWRRAQRFDASGTATSQIPVGLVNDVDLAPEGGAFIVTDGDIARLVADGTAQWRRTLPAGPGDYAWGVALAWDAAQGRLSVLDLGSQQVHSFDGTGQTTASWSFRPAPGAQAMLWDLAPARDGLFVVNRGADTLERRNRSGALLASWPVPGGPLRVASNTEGQAFVLSRLGWVWKYGPDGTLLAVWPVMGEGMDGSQPADLAIDAMGRVLVVDQGLNHVVVFARDPQGLPGEVPAIEPACTGRGTKTAAPERLVLGEETTVILTITGNCPGRTLASDIALVIDHSGSMAPGGKLVAAQQAALAFLDAIDWVEARVTVIGFNQDALVLQRLTANRVAAAAAIGSLVAGGGTDIAAGIETAHRELTGPRRRLTATGVVVLLTDGVSNPQAATQAAARAKLDGLRLFTIGFGPDAATQVLQAIASSPEDYYFAPDASSLMAIYQGIAVRVGAAILFATLTVTDLLPDNMIYVNGSGLPEPIVNGQVLVWQLADVPLDGTTLRYRVRPLETGTWPTNVIASGEGIDGLGQRGRVAFPVPAVVVIAATGTPPGPGEPTPTATARPSPTLAPTPGPVFLPLLVRTACLINRRHVDVVLVVDTSDSMRDVVPGGTSKLDAALAAARSFVALLEPGRDAVAVVYFNAEAAVWQALNRDLGPLAETLRGLPQAPGTRIDLGLMQAGVALAGPGRDPSNVPVVVVLTDGRPTGTTDTEVIAAAELLRGQGVTLYAIGLGTDLDAGLLARVAGVPDRLVLAPDVATLERIYADIAGALPCLQP